MFIKPARGILSSEITPKALYCRRREFLKTVGGSVTAGVVSVIGRSASLHGVATDSRGSLKGHSASRMSR